MDLMERKAIEEAALAKELRERAEREHEMEAILVEQSEAEQIPCARNPAGQ